MEETACLATNPAALPKTVLSHNLEILWDNLDHSACEHLLIYIFGLHPNLLPSDMHNLMPFNAVQGKTTLSSIFKNT